MRGSPPTTTMTPAGRRRGVDGRSRGKRLAGARGRGARLPARGGGRFRDRLRRVRLPRVRTGRGADPAGPGALPVRGGRARVPLPAVRRGRLPATGAAATDRRSRGVG